MDYVKLLTDWKDEEGAKFELIDYPEFIAMSVPNMLRILFIPAVDPKTGNFIWNRFRMYGNVLSIPLLFIFSYSGKQSSFLSALSQ